MENTEDKKPSNPNAFAAAAGEDFLQEGITLRDYFAAKAMQGICVNAGRNGERLTNESSLSNRAYTIADAMLKAREE